MNQYKHAVLTICTPVQRPPLDEPPVPEFDLGVAMICPNCGGTDPVVQMVNDASVARCPDCQHEFAPHAVESLARRVVKFLSERRRIRRQAALRGAMQPQERKAVEKEAFRLLGVP